MKRTLKDCLTEITRGVSPRLLLLHGDDFHVHEASHRILEQLVPEDQRAVNLECFDGRSTTWGQIEAILRTPPLFPGTKTIFIENAPYFLSRERKGELVEKVQQLWAEDKKDEAGRLLLDLMVLEGWTSNPNVKGQTTLLAPAGRQIKQVRRVKEMPGELDEILAYSLSRGMDPSRHQTKQDHRLAELLDDGIPSWVFLLISATQVDKRTHLYRKLEQEGMVLDLSLERERSGRIKKEVLADFLDRSIRDAGKKIEPKARNLLLGRAGDELWGIHQEMEKLLLYVGDQPMIKANDVEEIFSDQAEAWVFDLTASISRRDTLQALGYLLRLLSQAEPPLKILGAVAGDVRRLLAARQLIDGEFSGKWKGGMTFQEFQKNVLSQGTPLITQNPYGNYMSFQRAQPFTSRELLRFLHLIYQTDIRLKSTGKPPRMVMERLILEMCQGEEGDAVHENREP